MNKLSDILKTAVKERIGIDITVLVIGIILAALWSIKGAPEGADKKRLMLKTAGLFAVLFIVATAIQYAYATYKAKSAQVALPVAKDTSTVK